jgi:hypothetical protein
MGKLLDRMVPSYRNVHGFSDHFDHYVTADLWTTVNTDSGTITVGDEVAGVVTINASDGTSIDNDQNYMRQTAETFLFAANKPLVFEWRVRPVSNTIGDLNVIVGLKNAPVADQLADDGAVPVVTGSGVFFYKLDGGTKWVCTATINGTEAVSNGITTDKVVANNAWVELRVEVYPITSTLMEFHYFIDGVEVGWDVTTSPGNKIAQNLAVASATEMNAFAGVKSGAGNLSDSLKICRADCFQQV